VKITSNSIRVQYTESDTAEIIISTGLNRFQIQKDLADLKNIIASGKALDIEIKQHRKTRSLDANAMLWVMCQKIAEKIGGTKEDIYRNAIRQVGQFEIVPIADEAIDRWIECWNGKGIGWFAEIIPGSKIPGYTRVISYYGSSVYDTREMSVLLDNIITDAKEAGIDTMSEKERRSLLEQWKNSRKAG
jgi:hypothetical protein